MNGRHYIMEYAKGSLDPRSTVGAAAAVIVAMVNNTKDFDIRDSSHREAVKEAISEIVPQFCNTVAKFYGQDQYAE